MLIRFSKLYRRAELAPVVRCIEVVHHEQPASPHRRDKVIAAARQRRADASRGRREPGTAPERACEEPHAVTRKPVEQVRKVLGYNEHITSLDAPLDVEPGSTVVDQLADVDAPSPELVLHNTEIEGWIKQWLDELSDRQRGVIERRYGLNGHDVATLDQLARQLNVTRERVRQIQSEALEKLRARLRRRGLSRDALL